MITGIACSKYSYHFLFLLFLNRRFRRENEVMKMLWKLNYGDLLFVSTKSSEMSTSSKMLTAVMIIVPLFEHKAIY